MTSIKITIAIMLFLVSGAFAQKPEDRLKEMGIELPPASAKAGNYLTGISSGKMIYLSGKGAVDENGKYITGKLGGQLSTIQGRKAAEQIAIGLLADLKLRLGNLSKIRQIVKVSGYVNSLPEYTEQSQVMDGFSELMVKVFGEHGKHARISIGVSSLPQGMAVEIEMLVEIR
jgi:enamine deaminase RidA (YjgF/YER057c/UK114 family)